MPENREYARGGIVPPFAPMQITELKSGGPSMAERIVSMVLRIVAIIALTLVSMIMVAALLFAARVGHAVEQLKTPDPATTGCPFGPGQCGG